MEEQLFELSVTIGKLRTLSDTFRHTMCLDMEELDQAEQTLLIKNHTEHNNLYAVMTDYIQALETQINNLNEKISK